MSWGGGLVWFLCLMAWEDKGVHTFPKGICPKANVIAQLEFELILQSIPSTINCPVS